MTMTTYMFKAQADAMVDYLKVLWSENQPDDWDKHANIRIQVSTADEMVERASWLLKHKAKGEP